MTNKVVLTIILLGICISLADVPIIHRNSRKSIQYISNEDVSNPQEFTENKTKKDRKFKDNLKNNPQDDVENKDESSTNNENLKGKGETIINDPEELNELLKKTAKYSRPALKLKLSPDINIEDRAVDHFIAGCFLHVKLTTVYFDELLDLVFGDNDLLKKKTKMFRYKDHMNNQILKLFETAESEQINSIYPLSSFVHQALSCVVTDNYSEKFDDLSKKIINDFPTESKILEDEILEGVGLNVVQANICKVIKFMK